MWYGSGDGQSGNGDGPETDEPLHSLHDSTDPGQSARFRASGPRHYDQQQQHAFLSSRPGRSQGTAGHGGPYARLPLWLSPSAPQLPRGHAATAAGSHLEDKQSLPRQSQSSWGPPSASAELHAVAQASRQSGRGQPSHRRRATVAVSCRDVWRRSWKCRCHHRQHPS